MSLLGERYFQLGKYHDYIAGERMEARDEILRLTENKELLIAPCLCKKDDDLVLAGVDRWGIPCRSVLCRNCGLVRVSPRWSEDVYRDIYSTCFWALQSGSQVITRERFDLSVARAKPFAERLLSWNPLSGANVLELGCSYGAGLKAIADSGAKLTGYDWDDKVLELGRSYSGQDLRKGGSVQALANGGGPYDLIILRHVLEHIIDPLDELERIGRLLAPKGEVFVEVPGFLNELELSPDPLSILNVFHVYGFCLKTLQGVMAEAGFEMRRGDEHVYSLWRFSGQSQNVPHGNTGQEVLDFLQLMEKRRQSESSWPSRVLGRMWRRMHREKSDQ